MLVKAFYFLNPIPRPNTPKYVVFFCMWDSSHSIFYVRASIKGTMLAFKLSLFCHIAIVNVEVVKPMSLWKEHVMRLLNVSFLAWQILGILGSQIEIERFF
jgi:hypothetical protein